MKIKYSTLLILGAASLFATSAFAGTPEQDPVIEFFRDQFDQAKIPTFESLQLMKQWVCTEFSAKEDDFSNKANLKNFVFRKNGGLIENLSHDAVKRFTLTTTGMAGTAGSTGWAFIRLGPEGELLIERTRSAAESIKVKGLKSVANKALNVISYSHCPLDKVEAKPAQLEGECGTSGKIAERIRDCNKTIETSHNVKWALVYHSLAKEQVWQDQRTGLYWGDRVGVMNHFEASNACGDASSITVRGKMYGLDWNLPTAEDYRIAEDHGIREVLPKMAHENEHDIIPAYGAQYWTRDVDTADIRTARIFNGLTGRLGNGARSHSYGVHCVGH